MSKIALSGNASGTGTLTIAAPNTNSDRILNLPDSAGTLATAESTLTQFNASGSAPVYACRAWVNFDGTTTTPTIRGSGNVSSVSRVGTGQYTVNFSSAMPDTNYAALSTPGTSGTGNGPITGAGETKTTTTCSCNRREVNAGFSNEANFQLSFFR